MKVLRGTLIVTAVGAAGVAELYRRGGLGPLIYGCHAWAAAFGWRTGPWRPSVVALT